MGKPKYILLVRHGESEGNCNKVVNQHTANHRICLTSQGHEQARQAGLVLQDFLNQLDTDSETNARSIHFYTSPYLRARQTCEHIIEGIKDVPAVTYRVSEEPRMREQDFGNFQNTPEKTEAMWSERARYGHFFFRIPHGESAADVYDRVASFNETIYRQFQHDDFPNILILVTHGIWARVFLMKWFRWTYEEFESLRNIPHCQFLVMKRNEDNGYKLKTPLRTWDDLDDSDVEQEVAKEVTAEVNFHSHTSTEDIDIENILKVQHETIKENRKKDRELRHMYQQSMKNYQASYKTPSKSGVYDSRENLSCNENHD